MSCLQQKSKWNELRNNWTSIPWKSEKVAVWALQRRPSYLGQEKKLEIASLVLTSYSMASVFANHSRCSVLCPACSFSPSWQAELLLRPQPHYPCSFTHLSYTPHMPSISPSNLWPFQSSALPSLFLSSAPLPDLLRCGREWRTGSWARKRHLCFPAPFSPLVEGKHWNLGR